MTECLNQEEFDALLDKDANPQIQEKLRLHVASCDACQRELESLQHVDQMILDAHASIEPRVEWMADMRAMLAAESTRVDSRTVQLSNRPIQRTIPTSVLTTAAVLLIAATLALCFYPSDSKKPLGKTDQLAQDSQSNASPNPLPIDRALHAQSLASKEPAVIAKGDFLAARHPGGDDEIELYWVLPIQRKN